jgi:hypothetical protein
VVGALAARAAGDEAGARSRAADALAADPANHRAAEILATT